MKYLLFEKSAIETMVSKSTLQSVDFEAGSTLLIYSMGKNSRLQLKRSVLLMTRME